MTKTLITLQKATDSPQDVVDFKKLIKAAKKQKSHLHWVWHTIKTYDLRKAKKLIIGEEKHLLFIKNDYNINIGLMGVYNFRQCNLCKTNSLPEELCMDKDNIDVWYFILKEHSGHGYGKAALAEFIKIYKHNTNKIGACAAITNTISQNLLKSCGFKCKCKNTGSPCYIIDDCSINGSRWEYQYEKSEKRDE